MTLRLRGSKTELEEMGEDVSDMATTTSQLQAKLLALTGGQVDIMVNPTTFKNSTQILREMAAAWEDMNDIQRASALELMGGKRQANVLSALIQNFDTVEEAIEASAGSAGSALEENERWLDSIAGKMDQFNNSVQSLWQNLLGSDVIKNIIDWGTKIIKSLDSTEGKILAIVKAVALLMAFKKVNPLDWVKDIGQFMAIFNGQGLKGSITIIKQYLASLIGIGPAIKTMTAETMANTLATAVNDDAKTKAILSSMGLTSSTEMLTLAQRKQALETIIANQSINGLTNAEISAIAASWGLKTSIDATNGSIKVVDATTKSFMATNPIGWILAIASVLMSVIVLLSQVPSEMERLSDKISDLKSEISDLESELDSINSELQTTQERIAELIALPSLSAVEQEELDKLKSYNDELERNKKIKEDQKADKEQLKNTKTDKYIDKYWNGESADKKYYVDQNGVIREDGFWNTGVDTKSALNSAIRKYEKYKNAKDAGDEALANWDNLSEYEKYMASGQSNSSINFNGVSEEEFYSRQNDFFIASKENIEKRVKTYDETLGNISDSISMVFSDENFEDLSYGMSDTIDAFLDEQYAYRLKFKKADGQHIMADAISSMFDATASKEMQALGKELQAITDDDSIVDKNQAILDKINGLDGAADASLEIDKLSDSYNRLKTTMDVVGITAQDISDYFVLESGAYDSNTPEGIMNQYKTVKTALENLKSGAISLDDLVEYDAESGEATGHVDAIAEQLKGVSPEVRKQFTSIVEAIKEGAYNTEQGIVDWNAAIRKTELQGMQAVLANVRTELEAANKLAFPDLEISGWIDSVEELRGAFESLSSAMDLIVTAQEQMSSSGRISMKTALDLMATTDDWNQILEVNNGVITMNANAEQILIQSKLDLIKANIEMALQQVETDIALMEGAINSTKAGNAFTQGFTKALTNAQGVLVGLKAGWDAFWAGEDVASAFNGAYSKTVDNLTPDESSLGDLYKQRDNLKKQREMLTSVDTTQEFKNNYDFDKKPGDKYGEDDETKVKDGWEALINKYENKLALITNERDLIEAEIDKAEARGGKASAEYYEDLIRSSAEEKTLLEEQYAALSRYLEANKGAIDQDTWADYNNTLNDVAVAIKECESNTIAWKEALREIDIHYFEQATDEISRLGEELEFVNSLIEDEDVADENGNWSSAALTRMAMYTNLIEKAASDTQRYQDEIAKLEEQYKGGELSEEQYQDRLATLTDGLYDSINAQNDARDSIVELNEARIDAIKEGIEKEIEAYEDLIDAKKEELDAERDLYDFRKNIKKQTKDISELERRIASLSGSSAASDVAERRRLEAQLMEAKEGLNDTYYDHSRDAQSSALDDESEAYRESQEKRIEKLEETLDNVELLIQNSMMDVLFNADVVYNELNGIADIYGITLSDELTQPWKDASTQAIAWKDELKLSMTSGEYAALIGEGGAITVFANGVGAKLSGSWNTAKTAVEKYSNFLTGTELGNKFSSTITGFANQIQKIIDKWNGVKTAADNAYQAQLRVQNVGGNSNVGSGSGGGGSGGGSVAVDLQPTTPVAPPAQVDNRILSKYKLTAAQVLALGYGPITLEKFEQLLRDYQIKYSAIYKQVANTKPIERTAKRVVAGEYVSGPLAVRQYAKGTTGTTRDEWAITDEPQFGDELVLVPGKDGNLSFVRKGTGIVPADMTQKLFELAQIPTSDLMSKNLTAIVPNITKNDFKNEFNFESLVHVDTVDSDTLPKLEKMVDKKIDDFSKALNYSLKRFAR